MSSVEESTERYLKSLPGDLGDSPYAAAALAMAREMDGHNSATSKSNCAARHMEILDRLRELAPPERKKDGLDDLGARRAKRLAGKPASADQRGS